MHRPLRVPFLLRVWNLIKGVLFYNTVYWQKASDGLNMPKLTREEREKARPQADLEIIRPRDKPRAKLENIRMDPFRGAQISDPIREPQFGEVSDPEPYTVGEESTEMLADPHAPGDDTKYVKRRKYKRRRVSGANGGNGFFRRVFGK